MQFIRFGLIVVATWIFGSIAAGSALGVGGADNLPTTVTGFIGLSAIIFGVFLAKHDRDRRSAPVKINGPESWTVHFKKG